MARHRAAPSFRLVAGLGVLTVLLVGVVVLIANLRAVNAPAAPSVIVGDAGSGGSDGARASATPGSAPTTTSSSGSFREAQSAMATMVEARADWHVPDVLAVDEPVGIGLSIGDTEDLRRQIELNLPDIPTRSGGVLKVGTDVSAELIADQASIAVQPDEAINASFGSEPGLLWTWTVRPLRPADLVVRAHLTMTVPGTTQVLVRDLPLTLHVQRTLTFTAYQVFSSWTTWAAVVASAAAGLGWLRRRQLSLALGGETESPSRPNRADPDADPPVEEERTPPESTDRADPAHSRSP